jgi:hypothetical protein
MNEQHRDGRDEASERQTQPEEPTWQLDMAAVAQTAERLAREGIALGLLWAHHGLRMARLSLETQARTLTAVGTALGDLGDKLEARRGEVRREERAA